MGESLKKRLHRQRPSAFLRCCPIVVGSKIGLPNARANQSCFKVNPLSCDLPRCLWPMLSFCCLAERLRTPQRYLQFARMWLAWGDLLACWTNADAAMLGDAFEAMRVAHHWDLADAFGNACAS